MGWGGVRRAVTASALLVQLPAAAGTHPAAADVPDSAPTTAPGSSELSPEAAASQKAAEAGSPVEVSSETTPTQLVTVQPDGTFTVAFDPVPVGAKNASGWVPVDTDLETTSAGGVSPMAAAADIKFSGGGSGDHLASITQNGKTYSGGSPWALPAPTLSGSTARYPDVLSVTDPVVQAPPDGSSENLVVKCRSVVQNTLADPGIGLVAPNAGRDPSASDLVQKTLALVARIRDLVAGCTFQDDGRSAEMVREFIGQEMGG